MYDIAYMFDDKSLRKSDYRNLLILDAECLAASGASDMHMLTQLMVLASCMMMAVRVIVIIQTDTVFVLP